MTKNVVRFLDTLHAHKERWTLVFHRGRFLQWTGSHWREVDADTLEATVYELFEDAYFETVNQQTGLTEQHDFDLNPARITALTRGLQNKVLVDRDVDTPVWLDGNVPVENEPTSRNGDAMRAREMIACRNGLLHTATRTFFSHTPRLFNRTAAEYDYRKSAKTPKVWLEFLDSIWGNDPESIATLQEWFGYCLTSRTDLQKMLMIVGPKRAGKGTIVTLMEHLLGPDSVTSTSLAALNKDFGLANLDDQQLAIMGDVRFRSKDDADAVQNLLSITGEDKVLVNRKFITAYPVRLPTRIMMMSNELPKLTDESGALKSRIILLKLTKTFLGQEDLTLKNRLIEERALSGIFNWALEGLDRLLARGRFEQPKSALEDLGVIEQLGSPTLAFIADCCTVSASELVERKQLYAVLREWCRDTGSYLPNDATFGRNLRAAVPGIVTRQLGGRGAQKRYYEGIGLNDQGVTYVSGTEWAQNM
jgi:putative DNA primase/helicase